jgi:hypothetical protein
VTTPRVALSASRAKVRRFAQVGLVIVGVVIAFILAAWLLSPALSIPSSRLAGWQLANGPDGHGFAPSPTTTVIPVNLDRWPACGEYSDPDHWLAPPRISYTPWSVTITLYSSESFEAVKCNAWFDYWGMPVDIQLSEPLGDRPLFDGSTFPAGARSNP